MGIHLRPLTEINDTEMNERICATCEHLEQGGSSWLKRCRYKEAHDIFQAACSRYSYMYERDVFGETKYSKLIAAGLIADATAFSEAKDRRFK